MQRRDRASGVPLEILKHLPPNQSLPTLLLCALIYTSDFTGHYPPPPFREGVNLELQLIKIPGCEECFNLQTPLKIL